MEGFMGTSDASAAVVERDAAQRTRMGIRIWGEEEVEARTNLSRVTRWRLERTGQFPQRLRLTGKRVGWLAEEIMQWIESRPRGVAYPVWKNRPKRNTEEASTVLTVP